ncbi:MAG: hypothetical protein AAFR87_18845 [Bacteroidota bacterium]
MKKLFLIAILLLSVWILIDLFRPIKRDIHKFDSKKRAQHEISMWRSYYEKKPLKLFWQLASSLRDQYDLPFWQSFPLAYQASKAAFVFKQGTDRSSYIEALPYLQHFFSDIQAFSIQSIPVEEVSRLELGWWIIRRETDKYGPKDWELILQKQAALMYEMQPQATKKYAQFRVEAMRKRDESGLGISESTWIELEEILFKSWNSLEAALMKN